MCVFTRAIIQRSDRLTAAPLNHIKEDKSEKNCLGISENLGIYTGLFYIAMRIPHENFSSPCISPSLDTIRREGASMSCIRQ